MPKSKEIVVSKTSSILGWRSNLLKLDLNTVHTNRKCDISIIMENDHRAATFIHQLEAPNIEDDTIIVVNIRDLCSYFNEIMFKMPDYIDPATAKLIAEVFKDIPLFDLREVIETSIDIQSLLIKLRMLTALKKHIFKYESPLRYRQTLIEEYQILIDVPNETGESKKKGKKKGSKKKDSKKKSKSSKSSKGKKGKQKGMVAKEEDPCTMLQNNLRKQIRLPHWNSVTIPNRTLQIIISGCYDIRYLRLLTEMNIPIKCIVEVSLPNVHYPDDLSILDDSLREHVSYISLHSLEESVSDEEIFSGHKSDVQGFWNMFNKIVATNPLPNYLGNMYYLKYVPLDMPITENLQFYEEQCLNTYEEVKYLLESTDTVKRMFDKYHEHIRFCKTIVEDKVHIAMCFKTYNDILDKIPPDACTIPIILDALLDEVCTSVDSVDTEIPATKQNRNDNMAGVQNPVEYLVRTFLTNVLRHYRISSLDNLLPIHTSLDNILLNLKLDSNQIRLHESNKMGARFHSYLHLRIGLEKTYLSIAKRQPLCRIVKHCVQSDSVKNSDEINQLCARLLLKPDQVEAFLAITVFNLINWANYQRNIVKSQIVKGDPDLMKLLQILTGVKSEELNYCDSVVDTTSCSSIDRLLEILYYEKLSVVEMLQELDSNFAWYNSIKYYYCGLVDALLIEFDNPQDDFGVSLNNWSCKLRTMDTLLRFSRSKIFEETKWLIIQENNDRALLLREASIKIVKETKATNEVNIVTALENISFILKNTLKDVLLNSDDPQTKEVKAGKAKKSKSKSDKSPVAKEKSVSKVKPPPIKSKEPVALVALKTEKNISEKVFFADVDMKETSVSGITKTFISKDGVKINYEKLTDDSTATLNIDINQNNLIMHILDDEYFKFHFYLENDIIINFIKPITKSAVDCIQSNKLYTVIRNQTIRLNNFQNNIKTQSTYLLSDDVLQRIRSNMKRTWSNKNIAQSNNQLADVATNSQITPSVVQSLIGEAEIVGDLNIHELKTKASAFDKISKAEASFQPIFKICSSKLHQFRYIKRTISHAKVNAGDAVTSIANEPFPKAKHKYIIQELVGSIENDDITSNASFNYSFTLPTSLTVRSEIDIRGNNQIKQYYLQKGPQCKDIYSEISRTFTHRGDLIIKLNDGTISILSLNGDIIKFDCPVFDRSKCTKTKQKFPYVSKKQYYRGLRRLISRYHKHSTLRSCLNSSRKSYTPKMYQYISPRSILIAKNYKYPYPTYSILQINGKKLSLREGKFIQNQEYFPCLDEDFVNATFKYSRQDGTIVELQKNGSLVTTFPDKTMLISSYTIDPNLVSFELDDVYGENNELLEEESTAIIPWTLIHSSREFRHPNYATVRFGGVLDTTVIVLPCDITLQHTGEKYTITVNKNIEATLDTHEIVLATKLCTYCEGGTNVTINIDPLYHRNTSQILTNPTTLVKFIDSFERDLVIKYNADFEYNSDVILNDLNKFSCLNHRVFNNKKFYVLKPTLSGMRLWPKDGYKNRLMQAIGNSEIVPDNVKDRTDDIFFIKAKQTPLYNKYLMQPDSPDLEPPFETYRFLEKMPYNKYTSMLFTESEAVTVPPKKSIFPPDALLENGAIEAELDNDSSVTLFAETTPAATSCIYLTRKDLLDEKIALIKYLAQLRRDRVNALREESKLPINYFRYMEQRGQAERDRKLLKIEQPPKSNLKITVKEMRLIPTNGNSLRTLYNNTESSFGSDLLEASYISSKKYTSTVTHIDDEDTGLKKQPEILNLAKLAALIDEPPPFRTLEK